MSNAVPLIRCTSPNSLAGVQVFVGSSRRFRNAWPVPLLIVLTCNLLPGQDQSPGPNQSASAASPQGIENQTAVAPDEQSQQQTPNMDPATPGSPDTHDQGASSPAAVAQPSLDRDVSLNPKKFATNFLSDQKTIWTFPARLVTGHDLVPTLAVAGITTGLIFGVDPEEGRYFRSHASTFRTFNSALSEHRTTAATLLIPAGISEIGYVVKDKHLAHTGLLALEAWVDVDILDEAIRDVVRRERPVNIPPNGNFSNTWFKTGGDPLTSAGGFPSGHTGWGFAVATVIARRCPQHRWVRYAAYGLASVDLFSRLTSSSHFASDAFIGAAFGYAVGRFVVLRE